MAWVVDRMYHPSHRVPDLSVAREFFERVFAREIVTLTPAREPRPGSASPRYPTDYCFFTLIADVWFDTIDPALYVFEGVQPYPDITEPHLNGFGWGVQGIDDLYRELRRRGIRCTDQSGVITESDGPPSAVFSSSPLFWTLTEDTGLRYEFYPTQSIGPLDPRSDPEWRLTTSKTDPLGIERCSHHTVLTDRVDRALDLTVNVLGGTVIARGENELLDTKSTYVALADSVLEYAEPLSADSFAMRDWKANEPLDTYHSLTWKVRDLDTVERHLAACGVRVLVRTDQDLVAHPADCIGIPWGFTTRLVDGDLRQDAGDTSPE